MNERSGSSLEFESLTEIKLGYMRVKKTILLRQEARLYSKFSNKLRTMSASA